MKTFRVVGAGFACAVGCLGGASPAWAGIVSADSGVARFVADVPYGSQVNDVTITLEGGFYVFRDASSAVDVGAGCEAVDANTARCSAAGPPEVRRLVVQVGAGSDSVTNATATPSMQVGGDGDDELNGGSGNDVLDGQTGVDLISAGDGDDRLVEMINQDGADSPDRYSCGAGVDRVDADVADFVDADCENVTRPVRVPNPDGGGTILVPGPVLPDTGPEPGPCGSDELGTTGPDTLFGDGGRNRIFGLRGDDVLRGRGAGDCLYGGRDDDRIQGQGGPDLLDGGQGDDALAGGAGRDRLVGGSNDDRLTGGSGNDRLSGGVGNDTLIAGGGRNVLRGGGDDDVINSANGKRDVVNCGAGEDRVRADRSDRVRGCERVTRVS